MCLRLDYPKKGKGAYGGYVHEIFYLIKIFHSVEYDSYTTQTAIKILTKEEQEGKLTIMLQSHIVYRFIHLIQVGLTSLVFMCNGHHYQWKIFTPRFTCFIRPSMLMQFYHYPLES